MKKLLFLCMTILLLFSVNISANSHSMDIYVTNVEIHLSDTSDIDFIVTANISILNDNDQPVEFIHADLCRFKLTFPELPDQVIDQYPFACPEATELVEFDVGLTNTTAQGGLIVNTSESIILPDGNYTTSIEIVDYQFNGDVNVHGAIFVISNGSITDIFVDDIEFQFQDNDNISNNLNAGISFLIAIPVLSVYHRNRR